MENVQSTTLKLVMPSIMSELPPVILIKRSEHNTPRDQQNNCSSTGQNIRSVIRAARHSY